MEKIALYKKLLGELLFKKFLYLGESGYLIHKDGRIEEVGIDYYGKVRLVIIGKQYYFEVLKTFPFSNIKEIKSTIETDITAFSPFETDRFFVRKIGVTDESTKVNLWFINKGIAEKLSRLSPLFLIPESAFLSFLDGDVASIYAIHNISHDKNHETLYVYIGADRVVKSMILKEGEGDLQHFRRSVGGKAGDCSVKDIPGVMEYFSLFPDILYGMPVQGLLCFLNLDSMSLKVNKKPLKRGLVITAALFCIYTASSVLLPYFVARHLQEENRVLSLHLSGLLNKQKMAGTYHKKQKELVEKINGYTYKLPLLNLFNTILPKETTIRQLMISGNVVEMRGTAPKASVVLSVLSQGKGVKNARFSSPLREDKKTGMEIFTLTFVYDP
ncbi:MAG: hypothetical protein GWP10_10930 [Nitrospiraceae bacterium]|nr:hypothetical protein [Nitrospiraceae bacterium]